MKHLRILATASLILFAQQSMAALTGTWAGQSAYTNTWNSAQEMVSMNVSLEQQDASYVFALTFSFADGKSVPQKITFDVSGNQLMYAGEVVGEIGDDHFTLTDMQIGSDVYSVDFQKKDDTTATYSDKYCYDGTTDCESITGELQMSTSTQNLMRQLAAAKAHR